MEPSALPRNDGPQGQIKNLRGARICAAWAESGMVDEYVVYERGSSWTFAAGVQARIVVRPRTISVYRSTECTVTDWTGDLATALADSLALLSAEWRVYGWIGFEFGAVRLGLLDRLDDDEVLAHLIIPVFEAVVDENGIDTGAATDEQALRLNEIASSPVETDEPRRIDVSVDSDDYRGRVTRALGDIADGKYQKAVLSRVVEIPYRVNVPATYVRGRTANRPERSFLLSLGGLLAAGFSPELVVSVGVDRSVVTKPLAGTRARSPIRRERARAQNDLISDEKELAEHAISVRACFQEIESIALVGTAAITEFMAVRERGSVQHLASTIRGTLAESTGPWHALTALFPPVTASGVPKAPAVEAIYRLEGHAHRGLYSGAVVSAAADGSLEAALALRSVFSNAHRSWLRAGAGIVARSNPDREFEETCEKLASIAPYVVPAETQLQRANTPIL